MTEMAGWVVAPQVSFSIWGERGLVDLLAWHQPSDALLVIEIKTEVVDVEETVGTHDRKRRLAAEIARERGWRARSVSTWLVIADSSMNRRRVARHRTLLRSVYPLDGWAMRRWLRSPAGPVAGLSFWSGTPEVGPNVAGGDPRRSLAARRRVRLPRPTPAHSSEVSQQARGGP